MNIFEHLKAVFVDLDGTLVDSMSLLYKVYLDFLGKFGISGSEEEFQALLGPSIPEVVRYLQKKHHLPEDAGTLLQDYRGALTQSYVHDIQLFPHAREFLEDVKKRGLKLLLVTSAQSVVAHAVIDRLDISKFFDAVVTCDGLERSKPDPAIYKKALEIANVASHEAIAIEDTASGVQAAVEAGIFPIWMKMGEKDLLERREDPARFEVGSWKDLLEFLVPNPN